MLQGHQAKTVFFRSGIAAHRRQPIPNAMMKGTVMGPVVTPPASKATARNPLGTKAARRNYEKVKANQHM